MTYSQYREDEFLVEFFHHKKNGIFIDIGANDGLNLSNTYLLQKEYGWTGSCVEPIPEIYKKLCDNRQNIPLTVCSCYNAAVHPDKDKKCIKFYHQTIFHELSSYTYSPTHAARINAEQNARPENETREILIDTIHIDNLFGSFIDGPYGYYGDAPYHVDFLSIDTEGSELEILKSLNWESTILKLFL